MRSDKGSEYDSNTLNVFYEEHMIIHEITPSYSPKSNGITESNNKTLKEMMNAMLVSSRAALNLLGEAIFSTCHIQNRIPFKKTSKTPYELWKGYVPNINNLKVQGCLAKVLILQPKKRKIGPRIVDYILLGMLKIVQLLGS